MMPDPIEATQNANWFLTSFPQYAPLVFFGIAGWLAYRYMFKPIMEAAKETAIQHAKLVETSKEAAEAAQAAANSCVAAVKAAESIAQILSRTIDRAAELIDNR